MTLLHMILILARLSLLTRNVPRLHLVLTDMFSFPSHIDRDWMKRVRSVDAARGASVAAPTRLRPAAATITQRPGVLHVLK